MTGRQAPGEWGRRQLVVTLAGVTLFAITVVGGLAYTVTSAFDPGRSTEASAHRDWPADASGVRGDGYRDEVAARPMLKTGEDDMAPAAPALDSAAPMIVGGPTRTGAADVPTGFDHTPEGAVGQLAAIEVAVLQPMSVQYANDVRTAWAADPGGFDRWELVRSVRDFHRAAGTVDGDGSVSVTATPVGAQVKGTDGPDWVLACVQLDVTATVVQDVRFGFGHCERMQWARSRWEIAPGTPPATAPSTWPGSERSVQAGWLRWAGPGRETPGADWRDRG